MRRAGLVFVVLLTVGAAATPARADRVYLEGGRVIEGSAKQDADKVVIELEGGQVSVPAQSVTRIERAEPPLAEARKRERSIASGDIAGLLQLADFCRDHDLAGKERELLQRIVAVTPEHAEARRRLGFVHTRDGWIEGAELAQREQQARLERKRADLARDKQTLELKLAEAELARLREQNKEAERRGQERAERERAERERAAVQTPQVTYPLYFPVGYGTPRFPRLTPPSGPPPFAIPGVRDPRDTSFPIPGVRDPASYFDGAFRRH